MKKYICTGCGEPKATNKFGKRGKKRNTKCKQCINTYMKGLRTKNIPGNPEQDLTPLFGNKSPHGTGPQKVQRKQMVVLEGEVERFIKVDCPCGLPIKLGYNYSYDQKNDYYEARCPSCNRTFQQTVIIN